MSAKDVTTTTLDYARGPRKHRALRLLGALVTLAALGFCGYRWGKPWLAHATYLRRQSECLQFVIPPGTVCWAEGQAVSQVAGLPNMLPFAHPRFDTLDDKPPAHWTLPVGYMPGPLPALNIMPYAEEPIVFLGERKTATGESRLVVLSLGPTAFGPSGEHSIGVRLLTFFPATWSLVSRLRPAGGKAILLRIPEIADLRVFAAEPDLTDARTLHLRYEYHGLPGRLVGVIHGTSNVTITVEDGPLQEFGKRAPQVVHDLNWKPISSEE